MREPGELSRVLADEAATRRAGAALGRALLACGMSGAFITLQGDLGAGKTTLARGALEALGVVGAVRSPTYTLVESYPLGAVSVHHLDWYRIGSLDDLEGIGFRDLHTPGQWLLVEWPERVPQAAASADLALRLDYVDGGRCLQAVAGTSRGTSILRHWMADPA